MITETLGAKLLTMPKDCRLQKSGPFNIKTYPVSNKEKNRLTSRLLRWWRHKFLIAVLFSDSAARRNYVMSTCLLPALS